MRSSGPAVDPTGGLADGNSAEDVVIWKRTSAGQAELKRSPDSGLRAAAQNLLMILDGVKTEEMLLRNLVGVTREDFRSLVRLGLIEPADVIAAASSTVPEPTKQRRPASRLQPASTSDLPLFWRMSSRRIPD